MQFRLVLLASSRVAERMETTTASILIHCSDGWDRTAQLSAISQILLDGYFRTIKGFCTLVDKEWIHMGHKFHDRIGVASKNFKVRKSRCHHLFQLQHFFRTRKEVQFLFNFWIVYISWFINSVLLLNSTIVYFCLSLIIFILVVLVTLSPTHSR